MGSTPKAHEACRLIFTPHMVSKIKYIASILRQIPGWVGGKRKSLTLEVSSPGQTDSLSLALEMAMASSCADSIPLGSNGLWVVQSPSLCSPSAVQQTQPILHGGVYQSRPLYIPMCVPGTHLVENASGCTALGCLGLPLYLMYTRGTITGS